MGRRANPAPSEQLTVRIDKALYAAMRQLMRAKDISQSELCERALRLATHEAQFELPLITQQVRFMVNNATKAEQREIEDFLTLLRLDEVRALSEEERLVRNFLFDYLKTVRPFLPEVLKLYAQHGRAKEPPLGSKP